MKVYLYVESRLSSILYDKKYRIICREPYLYNVHVHVPKREFLTLDFLVMFTEILVLMLSTVNILNGMVFSMMTIHTIQLYEDKRITVHVKSVTFTFV